MKEMFKTNKGFTVIDIGIAVTVIVIFSAVITSVSYNVFLSETEARRTAVAVNYAVDIFENIGVLDYDDVNPSSGKIFDVDSLENFTQSSTETENGVQKIFGSVGTYEIELDIEDYNDMDLIKIITLKINYPISKNHTEKLELQRLKVKSI